MPFTIATWNINSVRLREPLVCKLLAEEGPDILCLQECKSPVEKIPVEAFQALGYSHMVARGQKGYNGVAILSKLPIEDAGDRDFYRFGHTIDAHARRARPNHYLDLSDFSQHRHWPMPEDELSFDKSKTPEFAEAIA